MRCAVITDEVSQDLAVVLGLARRHGFEGLEVRSVWNTPPLDLTAAQLRRIRGMIDDAGLAVAGLAAPLLKQPLPEGDAGIADCRDDLRRTVEAGGLLDAPVLRMFSFYRDGEPDPERAGEVAARVLEGVDLEGRALVLETGTRTNTPSVPHARAFLDRLGDPRVGLLWDPGNTVFSGFGQRPFPDDHELAADLIRHVHVKDPQGTRDYLPLGEGDLPWPAILGRLAADGYAGFVSLETHWRPGRTLTQPERDQPWGESFSAGGDVASDRCMATLAGWVADALSEAEGARG